MTEAQQEKWLFVNSYLAPLCMEIDPAITKLWYSVTDSGTELVQIQRKYIERVNVTGDSLIALSRDVLKCL